MHGMTTDEASSLQEDDLIVVLVDTVGCTPDDREVEHPAGTAGVVTGVRTLERQGLAVTVSIGPDPDDAIVATFDEADGGAFPMRRASANERGDLAVEHGMESAGAELMSLAFRLEEHPGFSADADRVREIGAWASADRPDDGFRAFGQVLGAMAAAMRRRGYAFRDDRPVSTQMAEMLDAIPDPLPAQIGYVDQDTLPPPDRRDVFAAEVRSADVRSWTAHDDVPRSLGRAASVQPLHGGVEGVCDVYAEGDLAGLLTTDAAATLLLRASGGALRVVGGGGDLPAAAKPLPRVSAAASSLLAPVPHDQELAAILAAALDLLEASPTRTRYDQASLASAMALRDALDEVAR